MPTVSVIMPAYNVAAYISAAIESVLSQYARFETKRLAAEARAAIEAADYGLARVRLAELYVRRGGRADRVVTLMARFAPALLSFAYQIRHPRLATTCCAAALLLHAAVLV